MDEKQQTEDGKARQGSWEEEDDVDIDGTETAFVVHSWDQADGVLIRFLLDDMWAGCHTVACHAREGLPGEAVSSNWPVGLSSTGTCRRAYGTSEAEGAATACPHPLVQVLARDGVRGGNEGGTASSRAGPGM